MVIQRSSKKDSAVSPVVGIMLMIVVTVVIAGVVGLVASGIIDSSSAQAKEPQIEFVGLYTAGYSSADFNAQTMPRRNNQTEAAGLLFKVNGNTPVDLTKLKLDISSYTGGGGFVSLTANDPVSTAFLPGGSTWSGGGSQSRLLPPEHMRGHRVVLFGINANDPDVAEKVNVTVAEPGDMFIFVPEYLTNMLSLAIGLRKDDENGVAIQSGGMSADGGSYFTLSNTDTGKQYVYHVIVPSDYVTKV